MSLGSKRGKIIAVVAGVAILAVVLVAAISALDDNDTAPDEDVVATVNGDAITLEDVLARQMSQYHSTGSWPGRAEMLEQLITESLLCQRAEQQNYVPTLLETEVELLVSLADRGITRQDFELQLGWQGLSWEQYLEEFQKQMAIGTLLDAELQWPDVTEEEVREYYEYYNETYPDDTRAFEEMEEGIIMLLERQRMRDALPPFIEELRKQADIQYMQTEV